MASEKPAPEMTELGRGLGNKCWDILGQRFYPKACCDSSFAFEAYSAPGDFFPVHIHKSQDKFVLVQEGVLDLKINGKWCRAKPGDFVHLPRGVAHGFFNRSENSVRALIWVSPAASLEALFNKLDGLKDAEQVVKVAAQHDVEFLPPEANE